MKSAKVSLRRKRSNKKCTVKRTWKVVWWGERDNGVEMRLVRTVYGQRFAAQAWRLWWQLYYMPHALEIELWRGRVRMMRVTAARWEEAD